MIKIEDLCFTYPGAKEATLNKANMEIEKGDFVALIGNNGCGKSTLCKVLNGLIPNFISGDFQGKVTINGVDISNVEIGELSKTVGYVYQDFENQIVCPTVLEDASYACMNYGMQDYLERGKAALKACGLEDKEQEYVWQLSGGQTHLLALAGCLSLEPEILILDEPIAQLDPHHADLIYDVLKNLNENYGKTIIVIEHHTEYIAKYCKKVALLKKGMVQWMHETEYALSQVEELQESNIYPPQITQVAYRLRTMEKVADRVLLPSTVEKAKEILNTLFFCGKKEQSKKPEKKEAIIQFENVEVAYRTMNNDKKHLYEGLNLTIAKGEKIALVGSNGAGKSSMMKLMIGLRKPDSGKVIVNGVCTQTVKPEQLAHTISMVYQNPEEMFIRDSIESDIAYAMQVRDMENYKERTAKLMERFGLTELKERDGRMLSGGQMRRASLAIGVALNPEILLLDEPTANLDIATRKEVMRTLNDLEGITETVIIATHDMQLVAEWAERVIVLWNGCVIADGNRDEIFTNSEVIEKVGIRPPEIFTLAKTLHNDAFCYSVEEFLENFA